MAENWEKWRGQVVQGKFLLDQYLGGSDRAAVFLIKEQPGKPRAVIKLILAKPASADIQLLRWKQAASLAHPHLLRLIEFGRCDLQGVNLLYVVMEYAEENLAQILPQRALTADETREMLVPVLDALAYLHQAGFVHGRLRPSNVLVVNDQLKLSSDGILKINEPNSGGQRDIYDAPEAATMTTSPAGDVWSLGMVLLETLTQHLPAVEAGKKDAKQKDITVPDSIPEPFHGIIRDCLRVDPQQRLTVDQIKMQLRSTSPEAAAKVAVSREPSAERGFLILLGVLALVVIIVAAVEMRSYHPATPSDASSNTPSTAQQETPPESKPAATTSAKSPANAKQEIAHAGVLHQVIPTVPQSARNTITGKVRVQVRVAVDPSGSVTGVTFISPGPSKYFAGLAEKAAKEWQFVPAQANGQNVSSAWILKFAFGRKATEVSPSRAL
jgi:TonB family protein